MSALFVAPLGGPHRVVDRAITIAEFVLRPDIVACRFVELSIPEGILFHDATLLGVQYDDGRRVKADVSALKFYFMGAEGGRKKYALVDTRELAVDWDQVPPQMRRLVGDRSRPMLRKKADATSITLRLVLIAKAPVVCDPIVELDVPEVG